MVGYICELLNLTLLWGDKIPADIYIGLPQHIEVC